MNTKKTAASIIVIAMLVMIVFTGSAAAKSLYVIANHHSGQFDGYTINPDGTATYVARYNLQYSGSPADVAIDESSVTLFITSEGSSNVELVDATTMTSLGYAAAPSANDLAGIEADDASNIVYTVNRGAANLYAYDWNDVAKTLTLKTGYPITLPNCQGAWGIALDETSGILYVADSVGGQIRGYDVSTWSEVQTFTPSQVPCDIAVDRYTGCIYTTAPDGSCAYAFSGDDLLLMIDIATGAETSVNLGHGSMGVAVDENNGYAYVTGGCSGDTLEVWDASTTPWTQVQNVGDIGGPAGICIPQAEVSVNPLNLTKDDGVGDCVGVGSIFTYTICYDNQQNDFAVHNVTIADTLPENVSFISASDGGVYDASAHTVTWDLGTFPASAPIDCVTLTVSVISGPNTTLINYGVIDSDETQLAGLPTTVTEHTDVCEGPGPVEPPEGCPSVPVGPDTSANVPLLTPFGAVLLIGLLAIVGAVGIIRRRT